KFSCKCRKINKALIVVNRKIREFDVFGREKSIIRVINLRHWLRCTMSCRQCTCKTLSQCPANGHCQESKMLREQFADSLKEAMKARDTRRTSTIRLIQTAIKDRDISNRGGG